MLIQNKDGVTEVKNQQMEFKIISNSRKYF